MSENGPSPSFRRVHGTSASRCSRSGCPFIGKLTASSMRTASTDGKCSSLSIGSSHARGDSRRGGLPCGGLIVNASRATKSRNCGVSARRMNADSKHALSRCA